MHCGPAKALKYEENRISAIKCGAREAIKHLRGRGGVGELRHCGVAAHRIRSIEKRINNAAKSGIAYSIFIIIAVRRHGGGERRYVS